MVESLHGAMHKISELNAIAAQAERATHRRLTQERRRFNADVRRMRLQAGAPEMAVENQNKKDEMPALYKAMSTQGKKTKSIKTSMLMSLEGNRIFQISSFISINRS